MPGRSPSHATHVPVRTSQSSSSDIELHTLSGTMRQENPHNTQHIWPLFRGKLPPRAWSILPQIQARENLALQTSQQIQLRLRYLRLPLILLCDFTGSLEATGAFLKHPEWRVPAIVQSVVRKRFSETNEMRNSRPFSAGLSFLTFEVALILTMASKPSSKTCFPLPILMPMCWMPNECPFVLQALAAHSSYPPCDPIHSVGLVQGRH